MTAVLMLPGSMREYHADVPHLHKPDWVFCCTPGCAHGRGYGLFGSFCEQHAQQLAVLRAEMDAEVEAMKRWGGRNTISGTRGTVAGRSKIPVCCNPYCVNPREPGVAFCEDCLAEGYMEDAA